MDGSKEPEIDSTNSYYLFFYRSLHGKSSKLAVKIFSKAENEENQNFWDKSFKIYFVKSIYREITFLSDPSPIIGYACHSLPNSLTHSLTHSCLVNLMPLNDANSDV